MPPSFFRSHLTMDTLDLGYILPAAGRIWDFHPIERALTGRTHKRGIGSSCEPIPLDIIYAAFLLGNLWLRILFALT